MDWFANVRKQAQNVVNSALQSEAAERARQLAAQATEQATALAKEASVKAQAVAKEALSEAEKGLKTTVANLRQGAKSEAEEATDPLQYGLTPELEQFVRSLTYSTFSDYPLDSLDMPADAAGHKLSSWQETHARLILQQVPQLQDLRFVLCPKRMDEYTFWTIYFTLCRRYLPVQSHQQEPEQQQAAAAAPSSRSSSSTTTSRSQPAAAVAAAGNASALSAGARQGEVEQAAPPAAAPTSVPGAAAAAASVAGSSSAVAVDAADDAVEAAAGDAEGAGATTEDELADLANDPELNAYLNDALQLDGDGAGGAADVDGVGSDLDDLDEYINKLDSEVS